MAIFQFLSGRQPLSVPQYLRNRYCTSVVNVRYYTQQDYLVTALDTKLKYYRNYSGSEMKKSTEKKEKAEKKIPVYAFPKPPEMYDLNENTDDDAAAHERRIKLIQRENKRLTPDTHIVSELMEKTFIYRRRQILEAPVLVADLLITYPFLCQFEQVRIRSMHHSIIPPQSLRHVL